MPDGISRIEPQCLGVAADRVGNPAEPHQRLSEIVVGTDAARFERDRDAQRLDGTFGAIVREQRPRQPPMGGGVPRAQLRQLLERRQRALGSARRQMNLSEQRQCFRVVAADGKPSFARECRGARVALAVKIDCTCQRIHRCTLTRIAPARAGHESSDDRDEDAITNVILMYDIRTTPD